MYLIYSKYFNIKLGYRMQCTWQPISSTVTFSQNLVAGYWVDLKFETNAWTMGALDNAKLPFTSSGITSAGSGTIRSLA